MKMHQNGEECHERNVPRLENNFIVCVSTALQLLFEGELVSPSLTHSFTCPGNALFSLAGNENS